MKDKPRSPSGVVDEEAIEALRGILREEFPQVVESFIRNAQRAISLIELAIAEGDRVSAIMSAHKLASSAGQIGLNELSVLARELENKAGHAPKMELEIIHRDIEKSFEKSRKALAAMGEKRHDSV